MTIMPVLFDPQGTIMVLTDTGNHQIRTFDMFCGGGGSSRGAAMAGCEIVGGLDMWDVAIQTHAMNFPRSRGYRLKASSLAPDRVLNEVGQSSRLSLYTTVVKSFLR